MSSRDGRSDRGNDYSPDPSDADSSDGDYLEDDGEPIFTSADFAGYEDGDVEPDPMNLGSLLGDDLDDTPIIVVDSPSDLAELAELENELDTRWPETRIEPSLTRIAALMDLLGSPQHAYPAIHIAGTNGKTSVTRMIDALMVALHRRSGRYTSPHLQRVTERIAVDGRPIPARDFIDTYRDIEPYVTMVDDS